ncbi:MAG: type I restriction enzyme endonuclease domain-containing protein [Verrucomicrobiota bacterium]
MGLRPTCRCATKWRREALLSLFPRTKLRKYHNRMTESSQMIEEMIQMAKDMQKAMKRHEELGLNPALP